MSADSRWRIFLDAASSEDARDAAWRALVERIRGPILFQLRRRIEGWRRTEDLADEVCSGLREAFEAAGVVEGRFRLRLRVRDAVAASLRGHGAPDEIDDAFERDWAASLFSESLRAFQRESPESHLLFLQQFGQAENVPPLRPAELAARLGQPTGLITARLSEGRLVLRRLFAEEIAQTVADPACVDAEVAHILPRAHRLLGD